MPYNLEKSLSEADVAVKINCEKKRRAIPLFLENILPHRVLDEIKIIENIGEIEEIRLRCGRVSSVTVGRRNILLSTVLSRDEMDNFLSRVCDNSLYAHSETINKGYVTLNGGVRIGICGRAVVEGAQIRGVYDISSMNIRIPHEIRNVGEPVCRLLRSFEGMRGVLIYAPPGEGKTTLLRGVASKMSTGLDPWRVALIDSRGELSFSLSGENSCIDVLSGYPRGDGIEIAARTMNAQLMICDEIGESDEAEAIISAQNCGVPFVASAHSDSIEALLCRSAIARLHRARIFGAYVGIRRNGRNDFLYNISSWEEADESLKNTRSIASYT